MVTRSMRLVLAAVLVATVATTMTVLAAGSGAQVNERFLIMMPHSKEQCLKALDELSAANRELLAKTEWGCMAGDHTGYVIVEAVSEQAALDMVPAGERPAAKVVRLNKFTPEQIRAFHKKS